MKSVIKIVLILFILGILLNCKKEKIDIITPEKINIFNNNDINIFIYNFINNQDEKNIENFKINIDRAKFIGSNLNKDTLILNPKYITFISEKIDSLFSKEDWAFIKKQLLEKKIYTVEKKYFKQKILNSDSLKSENLKINEKLLKLYDSLKYKSPKLAREIYLKQFNERELKSKNSTPIIYIDKPLFTKDKKKIIFSYYIYSGFMSAYSEVALYELKNNKWIKIKILREVIT